MINQMRTALLLALLLAPFNSAFANDYSVLNELELSETDINWVKVYAPLAIEWVKNVEVEYFDEGRKLTETELKIAKSMRVADPSKIRIVVTDNFPIPSNPKFYDQFHELGMDHPNIQGMTIGYIVFLKPEAENHLKTVSHEFVHITQVEKLGIEQFFIKYTALLKKMGYWNHFMEREARERAGQEIKNAEAIQP